jgi:hypothetical protein
MALGKSPYPELGAKHQVEGRTLSSQPHLRKAQPSLRRPELVEGWRRDQA